MLEVFHLCLVRAWPHCVWVMALEPNMAGTWSWLTCKMFPNISYSLPLSVFFLVAISLQAELSCLIDKCRGFFCFPYGGCLPDASPWCSREARGAPGNVVGHSACCNVKYIVASLSQDLIQPKRSIYYLASTCYITWAHQIFFWVVSKDGISMRLPLIHQDPFNSWRTFRKVYVGGGKKVGDGSG